ncbi:helix-turn-helix domain-containing protein, partial [Rhodococcus sp. IEGM 248]|nr:helix-turn-helix domain-containing protein [Rhodococcus sp. IEGM 248]
SVPRHTDGADHQDQPHTHAATQIGNVTDEHLPAARHPERRSTAALAESVDFHDNSTSVDRYRLAQTIQESILANVADPELSPQRIAAHHFISVRQLHKVFSEQGLTVASWIKEQRFARICRDLEDPLKAGVPVGVLAAQWGLHDASSFARSFRAAFGKSPTQYRNELLA